MNFELNCSCGNPFLEVEPRQTMPDNQFIFDGDERVFCKNCGRTYELQRPHLKDISHTVQWLKNYDPLTRKFVKNGRDDDADGRPQRQELRTVIKG